MDPRIASIAATGHTVAFLGFWVFIAVVVIAGLFYDYRRRRLEMDALRTAIEHGQHLDPAILERLLAQHRQTPQAEDPRDLRPYLHIGGIITIAAGAGIFVAGLWIGGAFPVASWPILGFGAMTVCVGIGLLLAARALGRYPPPERSPDRTA